MIGNKKQKGFTLLISALVASLLLSIGFTLFNIALKEVLLSSVARDSHFAFYAADSGAECAIYWSFNFEGTDGNNDAFAEGELDGEINCGGQIITSGSQSVANGTFPLGVDVEESIIGGDTDSFFAMYFTPDPYCAVVHVSKYDNGGVIETTIESRGYNTCDSSNSRRVERAVRVRF